MEKTISIDGIIIEKKDPFFELWMGMEDKEYYASDSFLSDTADLKSGDTLNIDVFTDGGNIDAGIRIYNAAKELQAKGVNVVTFNKGKQHSIGNVIMLGGNVRKAYQSSIGLVHLPRVSPEYFYQFMAGVTSDDLDVVTSDLKLENERMLDIYVKETGTGKAALEKIMHEEKTLSAQQLKSLGFITEIVDGESVAEKAAQNLLYSNKFMFNLKAKNAMPKEKEKENVNKLREVFNGIKGLMKSFNISAVNYDFTTQEGSTLSVDREDEMLAVGDAATIDGNADGEVTLEDGRVVVVVAGVITEIREAETEDSNDELENLRAENAELKNQLAEMTTNVATLNEKVVEFENVLTELEGIHTNYKPAARTSGGAKPANKTPEARPSSKEATAEIRRQIRENRKKN